MKHLRVLLLVLLAFLLPVGGATAAAGLCPGAGDFGVAVVAAQSAHENLHAADGMQVEQTTPNHHATGGDGTVDADSSPGGHQLGCQACSSGCCFTTLAFAPPSVALQPLTTSVAFPALSAPVAAFQSGGQDRPPRTI